MRKALAILPLLAIVASCGDVTPGPADPQALASVKGCVSPYLQTVIDQSNSPANRSMTYKVTGHEADLVDVELDTFSQDQPDPATFTYRISSGEVSATNAAAVVALTGQTFCERK